MRHLLGLLSIAAVVGCATADDPSHDAPVAGSPYWASGSATNEGKSTHLFIVNRAVGILGRHLALPRAARAYAWLTNPTCSSQWRKGLDDADHEVRYNNWYTWQSHFYDPATGTNYLGNTDPVAYDAALEHLATARAALAYGDATNGCYELGLALHYATDLTQPMHAANFAATDSPVYLHSNLEDRAVAVQNQFAITDWAGAPSDGVAVVLADIAWTSNGLWPATWNALANAYAARCAHIDSYLLDHTRCWSGDAGVDAAIGIALRQAQTSTAAFLYAADLP
jgi:phospholipase C